ncbi:MAG: hypothetical protein KGZ60_12655 [Truepera sp.]|nr:hypothetical protein [Truepera sp.]
MEQLPRLKYQGVAEKTYPPFLVRYPSEREAEAEAAVAVLQAVLPVVERYLQAKLEGSVRLDLLAETRISGVNPVVGMLRHSLADFADRSPRTAGLMSYHLGHILWHRASRDKEYRGAVPRVPEWLIEAALLPLLHSWASREAWLAHLDHQLRLLAKEGVQEAELLPQQDSRAAAQCLLRGQSLSRRHPLWHAELLALLAADTALDGLSALHQLTGQSPQAWERLFAEDLSAWLAETDAGEVA